MYMYMMKLTARMPIRIKLAYQAQIAMLYRPSKQIFKKGKFAYRIECTLTNYKTFPLADTPV